MKALYLVFLMVIFVSCSSKEEKIILTEEEWETMFPERWGVGEEWNKIYPSLDIYYPSMKTDFFSYDNFVAAFTELKNIKLKEVSSNGMVEVFRMDKRDENPEWVSLYTYAGLGEYEKEVDFNDFINKPDASEEDKRRELAAFLGNISHETGEGKGEDVMALFYREELFFERYPDWGIPGHNYQDTNFVNFPPSQEPTLYPVGSKKEGEVRFPVTSYHGRGPIQLSWNYNYGAMSAAVFGDKMVLLENPNLLLEDGKNAFMAAIWFWMFPQNPKPSAHEVMYQDSFEPTHLDDWGFGHTIMIINGNLEGDAVENGQENKDQKVTRRIMFYRRYADIFGITIGEDEQLDTEGMSSYAY